MSDNTVTELLCRAQELDNTSEETGHNVITFPTYQCHYTATEIIWARVNMMAEITCLKLQVQKTC